MRLCVVLPASIAAVVLGLSCSVGPAMNCFSNIECPQGMACADGYCVDGAQVSKDAGLHPADGGSKDGGGGAVDGGGFDGGLYKDGGVHKDGGGQRDSGLPACEDPCNSTDDCKKICGDAYVCLGGTCAPAPCTQDQCAAQCAPWAGMCDNGRCLCEVGQCTNDAQCEKQCYPAGGRCQGGNCFCDCAPKCDGRECGDDGCGGSCGSCPPGSSCNAGRCGGCAGSCGDSSYCGAPDGCGGSCPGYCKDPNQKCEPTPGGTWQCTGGCVPACPADAACGHPDGCGGYCNGWCSNGGVCNTQTGTCSGCAPACGNALCGGPDGCGGTCWGQCTNSGDQCVQGASGAWTCVGSNCDPNGKPAHSACTDQSVCACGNDCVIFGGATGQPQSGGECLAHCPNGGVCADGTNLCMCTQANGAGGCATSSCFPQGTLKGSFSGKVLNSCTDTPAQTDYGSGTMTLTMSGKAVTVNMFLACHYVDASTSSDYVIVYGFKACGTQMCPDLIYLGLTTQAVSVGTLSYLSGSIFTQWYQYTFSGQTVSDAWVRGYGVSGSVTLTKAGTTGKAAIAGTVDIGMIGYNSEICGGSTGTACQ